MIREIDPRVGIFFGRRQAMLLEAEKLRRAGKGRNDATIVARRYARDHPEVYALAQWLREKADVGCAPSRVR